MVFYYLVRRAWRWFGCEPKHDAHVIYLFMQYTIVLCRTAFYVVSIYKTDTTGWLSASLYKKCLVSETRTVWKLIKLL
jgi:hypothetical protein